jgi:hypothetical protein
MLLSSPLNVEYWSGAGRCQERASVLVLNVGVTPQIGGGCVWGVINKRKLRSQC